MAEVVAELVVELEDFAAVEVVVATVVVGFAGLRPLQIAVAELVGPAQVALAEGFGSVEGSTGPVVLDCSPRELAHSLAVAWPFAEPSSAGAATPVLA